MKYLVLIYGQDWTPEQAAQGLRDLMVVQEELDRSGELVSSAALDLPTGGKVVQVREGVQVVTDGPFGETKEQLAGYFMVDVADDDRAQQVAGRVSAVVGDRVELRGTVLSG
ncbi:hypothetical protein EV138_3183 [Kribbella voronezhensis]|uniref:YCII-related domain-containing protein n=1 Tax=Kribbella voronezhensis TaxID=2512212 RepID=A0A4R7TCY6_9ACTN|nr:YciI family protein [Kribbella voronezhensis]TDU89609.1 hypothetical protein EV138_3183 [Kribbella voronezhensis]